MNMTVVLLCARGTGVDNMFETENPIGDRSPSKLTPAQKFELELQSKHDNASKTTGNVASGIVGWRKLISRPMSKLVNYEGQFIMAEDAGGSSVFLKYSVLYPLFLWVRAGLATYMSDLWNVAEMISYICFITAFVCVRTLAYPSTLRTHQPTSEPSQSN
jgi:hypothetical protein